MPNNPRHLFVPFVADGSKWVVRRFSAVVQQFDTRDEALTHAHEVASRLAVKHGSEVELQVQDEDGQWHHEKVVPESPAPSV